jgi:hypothetical protein
LQRPSVRLCAALRCEAPCMVGDHQYPIRSVVAGLPSLPLAMAFSPAPPPPTRRSHTCCRAPAAINVQS